jgi:phosphate transport system permease protein
MTGFWKSGDPFVWLTGGALAVSLLMILALIALILFNGLTQFWPKSVAELQLKEGSAVLGEIWEREAIPDTSAVTGAPVYRVRLKVGNRDLYSLDFKWLDEGEIESITYSENAFTVERTEWGHFYGYFRNLKEDGQVVTSDLERAMPLLDDHLDRMARLRERIDDIERGRIGDINYDFESLRLDRRRIELRGDTTAYADELARIDAKTRQLDETYRRVEVELRELYYDSRKVVVEMATADGRALDIPVFDVVRIYRANDLDTFGKSWLYIDKFCEFVLGEPRESNTEGGVFPAIFGTVMLVLMMSVAVVPLGVLAAVYLHEYAKQGFWVRAIRIAVNNLAGVPSIVYGIFGLGFFIYAIGGTLDHLFFNESLPAPTFGTGGILWASLTLALLTVPVVIVATEEGLAAVPGDLRAGSLALAATKFETLWRIVIPSAMPGILTGLILSIARAAGEVAPLMITGVVKLAPSLPLDSRFPFLHLERKFMHLGFHIYDVGFQSPNVEAAIPMVYSTTLLLILIVILLNVVAIYTRNKLRRKLAYSAF